MNFARKTTSIGSSDDKNSLVKPLIELRDIKKIFGISDAATNALNGVDLTIHKGEFIAIMGPSGCGKTTLLNVIGLLDKASDGKYLLKNRDVVKISAGRKARIRNREIGFIFQNFNLINKLTIIDNVVLPLTYSRGFQFRNLQKASNLLKDFDLQKKEYYLPYQLSGGQAQRVAIARALVNSPSIILADEPTGNLDSKNSEIIMDELTKIHQAGNTILMVTHNPDLLSYASRVIYMKDGQIARDIELIKNQAHQTTERTKLESSRKSRQRNFRGKFQKKKQRRKTK